MLAALIICVAVLSLSVELIAIKLSPVSKANASLDLQKKAESTAIALHEGAAKILKESKLSTASLSILESTELQTLLTEVGQWLSVQSKVNLNALSKAQIKAYEDITNNVCTARVAIGKLLVATNGISSVGGRAELAEACPAMLERTGKLSVLESQMWAECVRFYSTSELATATPSNLIRSVRDRIPWVEKALGVSSGSALDVPGVAVVVSELREAWEVAEQLRTRYQKALVEVLLVDSRPRQQDVLRRLLTHKDTLILEYANRTTRSTTLTTETPPLSAAASALVHSVRSHLARELEQEFALCHVMLQDIASRGELQLQGYLQQSTQSTVGFLSAPAVARMFEEAYLRVWDDDAESPWSLSERSKASSGSSSKSKGRSRTSKSRSDRTDSSPSDTKKKSTGKTRTRDSSKQPLSRTDDVTDAPTTLLGWLVTWLGYLTAATALLVTTAAAGGSCIRAARARQQKLARAKKDHFLRPPAAAGVGSRLTLRNFQLGTPLTSLVAKLDAEIPVPVPPFHEQVRQDIALFCSEAQGKVRAGYDALCAWCKVAVAYLQNHPCVTWFLDYVDGKPVTPPGTFLGAIVAASAATGADADMSLLGLTLDTPPKPAVSASKKKRHAAKGRKSGKVRSASDAPVVALNDVTGSPDNNAQAETEEVDCADTPAKERNCSFDSVGTGQSSFGQAECEECMDEDLPTDTGAHEEEQHRAENLYEDFLLAEADIHDGMFQHEPEEGEWISTSVPQGRRNRSGSQNQLAKQLLRQQLLRKTTEARFLQTKAAKADAMRSHRWDKEREKGRNAAGGKRAFTGVPNPLTVSPDTVTATSAAPSPSRHMPSRGFLQPIPMRAPTAHMRASQSLSSGQPSRGPMLGRGSGNLAASAPVPHTQASTVIDEGEQSSLTDSDTSADNTGHTTEARLLAGNAPARAGPGNFPQIPNRAEPHTVLQYCAMLQHYYQQQVNLMASLGWTYVVPNQVPVVAPVAPEYSTQYAPPQVLNPGPGQPLVMLPRSMGMAPSQDYAAGTVQMQARQRLGSGDYFQPIPGPSGRPPPVPFPRPALPGESFAFPSFRPVGQPQTQDFGYDAPAVSQGHGQGMQAQVTVYLNEEEEEVVLAAQKQIEYYFSAENLIYDTYLRKLMDAEGFVDLTEIAQFRRIVKLAPSAHLLLIAVHASGKLEVREDPAPALEQLQDFDARLAATKLRCAEEPARWVIPADSSVSSPHST